MGMLRYEPDTQVMFMMCVSRRDVMGQGEFGRIERLWYSFMIVGVCKYYVGTVGD